MRRLFLAGFLSLAVVHAAPSQVTPIYENFGLASYRYDSRTNPPPQIDATVFANYGLFSITNVYDPVSTGIIQPGVASIFPLPPPINLPFDVQDMLYFTNRGVMEALYGFRFDQVTSSGRRPAASFY